MSQPSKQHFYKRGAAPCDEPMLYRGAGIEGIYLCSGFQRREVDGEWFTRIEDIQGLHNAIGLHLVEHRKALAPNEIRFLRNTMEKTQAEIAHVMGVEPQTVARWEKKGKSEMPGPADRMLRVLFLVSLVDPKKLQEFVSELQLPAGEAESAEDKPIMFVRDEKKAVWKGDAKANVVENA